MHLIGFAGQARAGKTTAAYALLERAHMDRLRGRHLAFADPLKELCHKMFPSAPREAFYGTQEQKEAPIPGNESWTGRLIMRHVGTEGFRAIQQSVWVEHLERLVRELQTDKWYDVVVVDDVRFPDECEALQRLGGIVYRVNRGERVASTHASESQIDDLKPDFELHNDGTLSEYRDKVRTTIPFAYRT